MKEIWKDIESYEGLYKISDLGKVKSIKRQVICHRKENKSYPVPIKERILKQRKDRHGYPYASLCKNGTVIHKKIHRLLAIAFISNPYNKPCINHKDGKCDNNKLNNLEWCTYSENSKHAYVIGLHTKMMGEEVNGAKLNRFQVQRIRLIHEINPKLTNKYLGKLFCVCHQNISNILSKKTWKYI